MSDSNKTELPSPDNNSQTEFSNVIISPTVNLGKRIEEGGGGIQLRTSARVSKKLKLEAEAAALFHSENKKDSPEEKQKSECEKSSSEKSSDKPEKPVRTVRTKPELWSTEDKNTFFEALNEYGKDFDSISKYMSNKNKKKGMSEQCTKNRSQVRCFYYRTWNKISKHLNVPEGVPKLPQELYSLINYGEMRKKCGFITAKNIVKLNELIYVGITLIRIRGKTIRIRTPNCRAMRKLNQIDDSEEDRVPSRITVELTPKDKDTWHLVQSMSLNPRVKTTLSNHTKVAVLVNHLQKVKWKQQKGILRIAPLPTATITLPNIKVPSESSSPASSLFSLLNHEKKFGSMAISNAILASFNQIKQSTPGSRKRHRADSSSDKNKHQQQITENVATNTTTTTTTDCDKDNILSTNVGAPPTTSNINDTADNPQSTSTPNSSPNKKEESDISKELPKKETILKGWTIDSVHNTQIGHLYSMFGSDGKIHLTYCWEDVKPNISVNATLQHLLTVAKLILNKNQTQVQGACPCGRSSDIKPNLGSFPSEGSTKSVAEPFKRPRPKEPKDYFQAQLDKFQPKLNNKRFRSKNLIVQRVLPLNQADSLGKTTIVHKPFNNHHSKNHSSSQRSSTVSFISNPLPNTTASLPVISHVNDVQTPPPSTSNKTQISTPLVSNKNVTKALQPNIKSNMKPVITSDTITSISQNISNQVETVPSQSQDINEINEEHVLETTVVENHDNNTCDTNDTLGNLIQSAVLSNREAKEEEVLDELMDISFPHSDIMAPELNSTTLSSFSGLIPTKDDSSISLPNSPSKLLKEDDSKWLNSEVADFSLSSLLGHLESPVKPLIPSDMQSLISESSVDYTAKFADLAAQMANDETCKN